VSATVLTTDIIAIMKPNLTITVIIMTSSYRGILPVIKIHLTHARGIGMHVKINMIYEIRSDLDLHNDHIGDMWIEVETVNNTSFLMGALYAHPNDNAKYFREILENSINTMNVERETCYLFGDFNVNVLSDNTLDQFSQPFFQDTEYFRTSINLPELNLD